MTVHRKTNCVSGSIFREGEAMQAKAVEMAKKRGVNVQIRSNRYDGFGRLAERACFYDATAKPDGTVVRDGSR